MQPQPNRRQLGSRPHALGRAVLWLACLAILCPGIGSGAARAEEHEDDVVAEEPAETPSEPEPEAAPSTPSTEPPPGVEVMRVRGRGIAAIETEVPSSVTQFDAATIEALGAQDISDLSRVTPNVNIVQPGTQATFFVRGVGLSDFSSNAAGAVTIFQDDVALNAPAIQTGQLFDVEGVDVVRGPQGSGPFRNASAGAIRVRSRRPTGNYTAQIRASFGRYDAGGGKGAHKALIQDYEGALEVPILEDWLSSRFAFRLADADPFMTNGCGNLPLLTPEGAPPNSGPRPERPPIFVNQSNPGPASLCGERSLDVLPGNRESEIPPGLPDRVGDKHSWAARNTFRMQPPGSDLDFVLNVHGSRLDEDSTLGQAMGINRLQGVGEPVLGGTIGNVAGRYFLLYHEPDQAREYEQLCGIAPPFAGCSPFGPGGHLEQNLSERLDLSPFRGDYNRVGNTTRDQWGAFLTAELELGEIDVFLLGSYDAYERTRDQDTDFTPETLFEQEEEDEAWQTYNEIRIGGELPATPFEWEVGGYYLKEELEVAALTTLGPQGAFDRFYEQDIDSYGVWGEFAWDFLDDFTLEGGVRWNWEKKEFFFERQITVLTTPLPSESTLDDETWSEITGQIILTYHLSQAVKTYARYTRGFKAGHFNALSSGNVGEGPADPEFNDAWEAGIRGGWLDGRVQGGAGFFYYRYENYQVFLFRSVAGGPPALEILNAKQAENYGIEVEGRIEPLKGWAPRVLEGLLLSGNFSWLHGEYLDFQIVTTLGQQVQIPITIDYSGNQLQNSPEFKVAGTAEWTFDLGRWGFLIPRYDLSWEEEKYFDPNEGGGASPLPDGTFPLPERFGVGQPAYFLHNLRLAYRTPTGNVEVAGWVRNLTDEVYKTFAFDASNFSGVVLNFVGDPRTIGFDVTVTF